MQRKSTLTITLLSLVLFFFNTPVSMAAPQDLLKGEMKRFQLHSMPKKLSDVDFLDADGDAVKLSSFKGKLLLINLWATWCPYCAQEMPTLNALHKQMAGDAFAVLSIGVDKGGPAILKKYMKQRGFSLPVYADPLSHVGMTYQTIGIPYALLIDQQGQEIGRISGAVDWSSPAAINLIRAFMR
jgi:thiol-disulfide isomerase/thioredoxin